MTSVTIDHVTKAYGSAQPSVNDLSLAIKEGEFFTLLGPSGCGKSTTLRMVAGFINPTSGRILFDGREVTRAAPNKRDTGMVFQNYALFPHMDVSENVAYGLKMRRVAASERSTRVAEALDVVGLQGYGGRRIDQLSGGQQQRVALARALVIRPSVLLLDEPLSNLDAKLRDETRTQIRQIQQQASTTTLYVTHDQAEAMAMSDRLAVMSGGVLHQVGSPREVYRRPATAFVARFIGRSNVIEGVIEGVEDRTLVIRLSGGAHVHVAKDARSTISGVLGEKVAVSIRPESLEYLGPSTRAEPEQGTIRARVVLVEFTGAQCILAMDMRLDDGTDQRLLAVIPDTDELPETGDEVYLQADPRRVWAVAR